MSASQDALTSQIPGLPPVVERLEKGEKTPICVIVVGMAGSGKSSLMSQMQYHANLKRQGESNDKDKGALNSEENPNINVTTLPTYCVNLDPATHHLSYDASIDIRDTISYKEVMKQHNLGPNGAILTSLNLYSTKFDQVMGILEKRAYGLKQQQSGNNDYEEGEEKSMQKSNQCDNETKKLLSEKSTSKTSNIKDSSNETGTETNTHPLGMEYILVDTPGQIESFTWSASGTIISESLASAFPTVLVFVIDTVRCASSPNTFMSNMLYACSMFYRTRLPLVIAFNKNDVVPHDFALEWMKDYDAFQEALDESMESNTNNSSTMSSTGFYGSLTRSLSLVLDEFYSNFTHCCGVSAVTGDGMDDFWNAVQKAATEDFSIDYIEDLKNRLEEQRAKQTAMARVSVKRMERDLQQQG